MRNPTLEEWIRQFMLSLAPVAVLSSCCPAKNEVFVIDQATYDSNIGAHGDGNLPLSTCDQLCVTPADAGASDSGFTPRFSVNSCRLTQLDFSIPAVDCDVTPSCVGGRRPPGLRGFAERRYAAGPGSYFARMAGLEAASVPAFRQLAAELKAHGATRSLIRRAKNAATDEVRHARVVGNLARLYGSRPSRPVLDPKPLRGLAELAADNAAEGCVREAFGAFVTAWQAMRADLEPVRRALAPVAADEARHARLSWAIARWSWARLANPERERVLRAKDAAVTRLANDAARRVPAELVRSIGLPTTSEAQRAIAAMFRGSVFAPQCVKSPGALKS